LKTFVEKKGEVDGISVGVVVVRLLLGRSDGISVDLSLGKIVGTIDNITLGLSTGRVGGTSIGLVVEGTWLSLGRLDGTPV